LLAWLAAALFGVLAVHHENLFWISGASSLLSALFFFWAIYAFILGWTGRIKHTVVVYGLGTTGVMASMLSYDGAIFGPLAIWLIGTLVFRKKPIAFIWITVLIPLYWLVRQQSGAIFAEGDYAYNLFKLPVNIVANSAGYLTAIFAGPRAVEFFGSIRSVYKTEVKNILIISGFVIAGSVFIVRKIRTRLRNYSEPSIWILSSVILLIPYLGLGGIAERYVLTASGLCIIGLGIFLDILFESNNGLRKVLCYALLLVLIGWNISETGRVSGDWGKAHEVSMQTLLTMKREFFPVKIPTWFAFVNVPIRYGRAWVFPTGMDDALWHLFRGSQYHTYYDQTLSSAFDHDIKGSLYVLTFENYTLKRVQRDIQEKGANP
jgi:hypothetical protein